MKVLIISPGKAHDRTVAEAIHAYEKRLRKFPVEWVLPSAGDKVREAASILKHIKSSDFVVLLDERGKDTSTPDFAALLSAQMQQGTKRIVFVIGGAFGVGETVMQRGDMTLKLSSFVFPHMLVRLILVEQLYRAESLLSGGKYHHA